MPSGWSSRAGPARRASACLLSGALQGVPPAHAYAASSGKACLQGCLSGGCWAGKGVQGLLSCAGRETRAFD